MKQSHTKTEKEQKLYNNYVQSIPKSLRDILIPDDKCDQELLLLKIKSLRIIEEERRYVLDIQNQYNLPIHPNESLKKTMIRVRLHLLKLKKKNKRGHSASHKFQFPVDPLE